MAALAILLVINVRASAAGVLPSAILRQASRSPAVAVAIAPRPAPAIAQRSGAVVPKPALETVRVAVLKPI